MNFFKSLAKKRPGSAEPVVETEDIVKNSKKTKKPKNLVVNTEDEISIGGQASIKERIGMEEDGISTETIKGKALRAVAFFNKELMEERLMQHKTKPHTPPTTPTEAIPHPSYSLLDEHPGHLYHEPPMTSKKTLKPPGGHKQQGMRFADDTNIVKKPEVPKLSSRPITYDGRASGRETFFAATAKKQLTPAEQEAKRIAKAKKEGAYVPPARAAGSQKENDPFGAQSQPPVQMPGRPSSSSYNAESSRENRIPQFGDFNNIRGVIRETLHSDEDYEMGGTQQPMISNEAAHLPQRQRQYSGGNKPPSQGLKTPLVIGDMGPPPVPQNSARRNAATSKKEIKSRVVTWLDTDQDETLQNVGDMDQLDDDAIMQYGLAQSEFSFIPHLLPGARGAAQRFPPPQPKAGPGEDYQQFFNPEQSLCEPQDSEMRELAADLVNNTNKTPPCEHRRMTAVPMVRKFKELFLDAGVPDGMLSPRAHAEMITRNANSRMYANRLDNLLRLCDSIECLLCCRLPHNKRRYPAPPFCPSRMNPLFFPPSPDENKLFVADNLYDESIQLLSDALCFMLGFERHGISQNPLLYNDDVRHWLNNFEKLENSLNRMGALVNVIGTRCMYGQWDYVAGMGEVLNAVGGIWTVVTGTLRPPNWEGRIPHLSVGIDPANIPPNSVIVALQSPQVTSHPQQPTITQGNPPYNYQQQADQYRTIPSPAPSAQAPVAASPGYNQHPGNTYRTGGTSQYPGTNYQRAGHAEYDQQSNSTYQTAGHPGYSQYPSTTYETASNSGTTCQTPGYGQQPSSTYQTSDNGYGLYPGQNILNGQWVPNPVYSQPPNSASTFSYSQQNNTGGPAWY